MTNHSLLLHGRALKGERPPASMHRNRRSQCRLPAWLTLATLFSVGCGQRDGVRSYTVERIATDRPAEAPAAAPGQAWFFKLMGDQAAVSAEADAYAALMASVRFDDAGMPQWEAPEGWTERKESGMRFATLTREGSDPPLEIAVSALPAPDPEADEYLKLNVDRWRGQVGLPPYSGAEWKKQASEAGEIQEFEGEGGKYVLVRLDGSNPDGEPVAMLASVVPRPSVAPPVVASNAPMSAAGGGAPAYTAPAEWTVEPPRQFQTALWSVSQNDQTVEVSVSQSGGSLELNVERWAGQVGLSPDAAEGLETEALTVGGLDAVRVELIGAEKSIIGVIVPQGRMAWFFKMTGPPDLVDQERERFQAFIESVQFP